AAGQARSAPRELAGCHLPPAAYCREGRRRPGASGDVVPFVSILFGLLLVGLGVDGYADVVGLIGPTEPHSPTALIPAYFGAALILCGLIALNENLLKHAMHAAAMVGLVGLLAGAGMGLPKLPKLLAGEAEHPA